MYPKACKSGCNGNNCGPIFIAALFKISKLWKQPRFPTTHERIKKMWNIDNGDLLSH
jgi:hypothetical protein